MSELPPGVVESQLFRALFETAPDAMIVTDRAGCIVLANPQAEQLFDYPPGTLRGELVEVLLPAGLREVHKGHRANYMEMPRVRNMGEGYELTGVRRDGQAFPVEIGLSPIATAGDTLYAASIRDISATQRARQAMVRARYDVFVAQAGRLLLESPNDEVAIDGLPSLLSGALQTEAVAVVFMHPRTADFSIRAVIGLPSVLQQRLLQAFAVDGMNRRLALRDSPVLTLGKAAAHDLEGLRHALAGSSFRDAAMVPLFDRHEPMGMVLALAGQGDGFGHDKLHFLQSVANMLAATMQRSRSEEQLAHAQRLDALGQLTGGIAHDFNNLLTVISGNLQLLEAGVTDASESAEIMASAARAVDRCTTLTRKLLGFARRRRLVPVTVHPELVLSGLADMLGRTLGGGIVLHVDCPAGVPAVHADPGELDAALVNLAVNARDAMPAGGRLDISVRERHLAAELGLPAGDYVVFAVADNGAGMSRDVLARAQEPFFSTKEAGKGSGMGLSMVYGFVRQSGGQMIIDSALGTGTRVELLLPVAKVSTAVAATESRVTTGTRREQVLVVEDEPDVRRIAGTFLRSLGYLTHEAADAASALTLLEQHPQIALMFSDVMLGGSTNGVELANEARARHPALAVLLTSGYEPAALGAADVGLPLLRKPYRRDDLALAAQQALQQREMTPPAR